MIAPLLDWLDSRTGFRQLLHEGLYENIPSGARWRYVTGSMLVFAFTVQAITGVFLWMAYSPSSQTAYESVYFIQHEMAGGWLLRGVHHFMAQAMVVVMGLHLLQVVWDGAYRAPREINYWLGLVLMQIVLGLGLTGYLLPWDQKGYWATNVATNLMTLVPFAGKELQQLAVGGSEYGHHTLTRFFAMHTGVLPALLVIFLGLHIAVFRRHGITAKVTPGRPDQYFWPHQVLLDAVACLALLVVVLLCVIHWDLPGLASGHLPEAHRGAELGAPADPAEQYSAARPEWYYLFLFQLLKYFHGTQEFIGAIVIPGLAMSLLFLMPVIGVSDVGHRFNRVAVLALLLAAVLLTGLALQEDGRNPEFHLAKVEAEHTAHRTHELIQRREVSAGKLSPPLLIPKQGAVYLLRNDPLTQGPKLFRQHCASCHAYLDPAGEAEPKLVVTQAPQTKVVEEGDKKRTVVVRDAEGKVQYDPAPEMSGAPNLFGFASREWIRGLLDPKRIAAPVVIGEPKLSTSAEIAAQPDHPDNHQRPLLADYFGGTAHRDGRMAQWVQQHAELLKGDDLNAIAAALSAQARLRGQAEADATDAELIQTGVGLIQQNCTRGCHRFGDEGDLGLAPDLTSYGSYEWMMGFVSDPTHERFYRAENDRMPAFARNPAKPAEHAVSLRELSLIVDWLRGDYYRAEDLYVGEGAERKLKDEAHYAAHPHDHYPTLPHTEEQARQAALLARLTDAPRSEALVGAGPPRTGDKATQAQQLFRANCAQCHSHTNEHGVGIAARRPSAPNLFGFASRGWLTGLLDPERVASPAYFGDTRHVGGDMAQFVADNLKDLDDPQRQKLQALVIALSAEAALPAQAEADAAADKDGTLAKGRAALAESWDSASCVDCHKFRDEGDTGSAPDLTGYGSREWLAKMIADPTHGDLYRDTNDRMPSFGKAGGNTKKPLLSADQIDLLARWLRGEKLE